MKLSEQNQKIVGILTIYSVSEYSHITRGLCFYFRDAFWDITKISSYDFFDVFVQGYLVSHSGYCKERQIMTDMIIELFVTFNPTLKEDKYGAYSLKSRKKGFKEALNMIRYYGGYR